MANLIVRRGSERYAAARKLKVYVDGDEVGGLKRNESVELDLEPGDHEIHIKMDWVRSPPLTVSVGGDTTISVRALLPQTKKDEWIAMFRPKTGFALEAE